LVGDRARDELDVTLDGVREEKGKAGLWVMVPLPNTAGATASRPQKLVPTELPRTSASHI
jgi:hypothetical protein